VKIPIINPDTMSSILEEVYTKNETFGVEEFSSGLETDNKPVSIVLYSFINAVSDYMANDDPDESEQYVAISKICCNLLYKTIEKQLEINEMSHE